MASTNLRECCQTFHLEAVSDDNSAGRIEYRLALRQEARLYGVTLSDLANQTRAGFFGIEATSVQRGADNVAVMVRYPAHQRDSLSDLLSTWIATPSGDRPRSVAGDAPGWFPRLLLTPPR